jgi:hypothetical protein
MKNTQVEAMIAPAGITVEGGGGWKFAMLEFPESRLPAPKILPMPSAVFFSYSKSSDYERWAFLPTSVMALHLLRKTEVSTQMERYASSVRLVSSRQLRVVRTDAQEVRSSLCYPMPAAPLS